jgi:hypothetical protein
MSINVYKDIQLLSRPSYVRMILNFELIYIH